MSYRHSGKRGAGKHGRTEADVDEQRQEPPSGDFAALLTHYGELAAELEESTDLERAKEIRKKLVELDSLIDHVNSPFSLPGP